MAEARLISRGYRIPAARSFTRDPLLLPPFNPLHSSAIFSSRFLAPVFPSSPSLPPPLLPLERSLGRGRSSSQEERGKRVPDTRAYFCIDCRQGSPLWTNRKAYERGIKNRSRGKCLGRLPISRTSSIFILSYARPLLANIFARKSIPTTGRGRGESAPLDSVKRVM